MSEALAETGTAMTHLRGERVGGRRRGGPRQRRPHAGGRGAAPRRTRRTSSSRSCSPHLETPEWKAVEKKLSAAAAGRRRPFFAWLTDGMSDDDRAFLRSTVPTPVVAVLAKVFGRRYNREIAPGLAERARC